MRTKLQLLCAVAALLCAAAPGPHRAGCSSPAVPPAGEGDGYGMKLCGREFIRAVIFTCGGSRWKRLSALAVQPTPAADSARTASNKLLGSLKLQPVSGPEVEQPQRSSQSLGWEIINGLYNLNDNNDNNEYVPVADDFKELVQKVEEAVKKERGGTAIANPMGLNNYLWAKYPRRKRDSLGLAGICCKWGCTKAEISAICRV